eukprot:CAMPEP_0113558948 /NCGR_PEP_ID=MMETSP0015_2-20120614/18629_1 /TAXON_ID=2838 /ORGANISM="Odontella" /LENGTH=310 /DNA_ID=CAMNT_0000460539 /DNA_START=253 /DNA_END=1185 /DNA_ORIENTATION=+ /assembly_acc=CAM_ASM_000160
MSVSLEQEAVLIERNVEVPSHNAYGTRSSFPKNEQLCAEGKESIRRGQAALFMTFGILLGIILSNSAAARDDGVALAALDDESLMRDMAELQLTCPDMPARPPYDEKARRARWMVHSLDWGVLSTISTRTAAFSSGTPVPFGNIYSFADGPCQKSSGVPFLFASDLDQSMIDIEEHPIVSLSLSEAELPGPILPDECVVGGQKGFGDPENPPCARLVLTGEFVKLSPLSNDDGLGAEKNEEWAFAHKALLERHPSMAKMPKDHLPFIGKINLKDIWLIDMYGGAAIIDLDEYYAASLFGRNGSDGKASAG